MAKPDCWAWAMAPSMVAKLPGGVGGAGRSRLLGWARAGVGAGPARFAGSVAAGWPTAWRGGVFQSLYRAQMPAAAATTMKTIR